MPVRYPPETKDKAKKYFLRGLSYSDTAKKMQNVSEPTIKRWAREGKWQAERLACEAFKNEAIESYVQQIPKSNRGALDHQSRLDLVNYGIRLLLEGAAAAPVRSRESALLAIAKLLELQIQLDPVSMDELAEMALSTPNFSVQGFVDALRRRMETQA